MTEETITDPFEAFARSLERVEEAKAEAGRSATPVVITKTSTKEDIIDFYCTTFLKTKQDIAIAKAIRQAAREFLVNQLNTTAPDDVVNGREIHRGSSHAVSVKRTKKPVFDKADLRSIDVPDGTQPPQGLVVSYRADPDHADPKTQSALLAAQKGERENLAIDIVEVSK